MAINKKEIKPIITFISNKYNILFNNLKNDIEGIINSIPTDTDYNSLKCHAYIMVDGNKVQCSRSKKENCGNFCKTHHRHDLNNELRFGKINLNEINNINQLNKQDKLNNQDESNNKNESNDMICKEVPNNKKKIEVEYININEIDYLYNPITKYVYDFETQKKIGKLDNDLNIIKKTKTKTNNV